MTRISKFVKEVCEQAGISINGQNPWDIQVRDERFFSRVVRDGSLGLGESYMDEWWECDDIAEMISRLLKLNIDTQKRFQIALLKQVFMAKFLNLQSLTRAFMVGEKHYDVGNVLYERMLDKRMVYTCAYWKDAQTLDQAQEHKLRLVCEKLNLKPKEKVLDIGCGWGSFAKFAAQEYGVQVIGITISKEQQALARKNCEGLDVDILLQDYRELPKNEYFDKIVSLGMIEHVGYKNYRTYMQKAHDCLIQGGLFLVQTIGANDSHITADPWVHTYIFPNGMLPSIAQLGKSVEKLFVMEDVHNFAAYYEKTLHAWEYNLLPHKQWIIDTYGMKFFRMWMYYLRSFQGMFRARRAQLWQLVFSKNPEPFVYNSIR